MSANASELTEAEREALRGFVRGGSHSPSHGYDAQSRALHGAVESILAARAEQIAQQIEAAGRVRMELMDRSGRGEIGAYEAYAYGHAACIVRGGTQ